MSAPARAVALTGSDQAVLDKPGVYRGITVANTGAAAGTVKVYDNASAASGTLVETIALAADASLSVMYDDGIWVTEGLFVDVADGTFEGSVRLG